MTRRSTKSALLSSVLALFLCITMLMGTTFAWFTDSVTSANNIIKSGNLDIALEYWNGTDWKDVQGSSEILDEDALWEPGYTDIAYLRMKNAGSLALKYLLGINIVSETEGKNQEGNTFKLSDYIYFDVVEGVDGETAAFANRDAAMAETTETTLISAGYSKSGALAAGSGYVYLAMIVYMPTTVGNVANHDGTNVPEINLGINVFATQMTAEEDSFDENYDAGAPWTGMIDLDWYDPDATELTINSAEDLAGLAAIVNGTATTGVTTFAATSQPVTIHDSFAGKTIKLTGNVDLRDMEWTPIGRIGASSTDFTYAFKGTFDGQNYTISNLKVTNEGWAGLIGLGYGATIQKVNVVGATINSNRMAGTIAGQLYGSISDCHVTDAYIMVTPNAVNDTYDNGDKVGGIVGWIGDNGNNRILSDCSVTDAEISAYRDFGGIAGYVAYSTTVSGNKVTDIQLTADQVSKYYGEKDINVGAIWGRNSVSGTGEGVIDQNNTSVDVSIENKYLRGGVELRGDGENVTLYLVPATYAEETLNVPDGVDTIGNYAFAYNSNVKTVVLPSTVRDLGRGFDGSTVEKVVLNDGLTTISSRAFRSTPALKEVVIPSSVTVIADNAFQKSGIKTVTIPASVETIGETAFGASLIETVIFEGNTDIEGYAFRGCTKLRTVYLNGEDVNFVPSTLNGRNSMWFCNGESNNPNTSNITFFVRNETVKERVLTAMGAERNNTTVLLPTSDEFGDDLYYTDESGETAYTHDANGLVAALENGMDVVLCDDTKIEPAGMSNAYGTTGINVKNGQTINGNGAILDIKGAGGTWDSGISTTGGTIKNITVTGSFRGIFVNHNSNETSPVYLENVIIDGTVYTISCDQGNYQTLEAKNCTFNGWTSYAATLGSAKFINCSFGEGSGYAFCRPYAATTFVNCDFEAGFRMDPRAAVTFENCTIGGVALTAENLATLVIANIGNATVIS